VLHSVRRPIANAFGLRKATPGQKTSTEDLPFFFAWFYHYCIEMAFLGDLSVQEFLVQNFPMVA
jgi:hypothetical protein